jgi:hypothetical protein
MEILTKFIIEGKNMSGESGQDDEGRYIKYEIENNEETVTILIRPKEKQIEKS